MSLIEGTLERITYHNEENGYTVAKLRVGEKSKKLVTAVGYLPNPSPGESLKLKGKWVINPKYGRQFKVETFESVMPVTLKGIEKYLGSGCIKGIGPVTASKLVAYFGEEVLYIIEHHPERLCEIEGIGEKKAEAIAKGFEEQKDIREVMIFLQNYEVSPGLAAKIYRKYGKETFKVIKENPYRLASEVRGIGFRTADKIALKLGLDPHSPHRIKAAVLFVLWEGAGEGHVFLTEEDIVFAVQKLFLGDTGYEIEPTLIKEHINNLESEREIYIEKEISRDDSRVIYLSAFYHAEKGIVQRLLSMKAYQQTIKPEIDLEPDKKTDLTSQQQEALKKALEEGVLIITGGPGTGKTTTIKAIINLFEESGLEVTLAAPTGRAARRMAGTSGKEAKTIHRLLEYAHTGQGWEFQRNEKNPLKLDVLIIDEMSMVDLLLMYNLLKALPPSCRLILVGDMDQLPSVGAGNVLRELIKSDIIPVVILDRIFRQAQESMIIVNAHRINRGELPFMNNRDKDFFFLQEEDPEKIIEMIVDLCSFRIPKYLNVKPLEDIQVITPMRKTVLGVENLNRVLQRALNPSIKNKVEVKWGGEVFRLGDKVMQIKNNYQKEVYNGDIGLIKKIDSEDGELTVEIPDFDDRRSVNYSYNELDELTLSYAISVHKSQGSEYPVIVMPVVTQHYILLQRNLIYTAITRARKMVVVVGTKKAMAIALRNNRVEERCTLLSERLREE